MSTFNLRFTYVICSVYDTGIAVSSCNVNNYKGKGVPCPKVSLGGVLISLTWALSLYGWINQKSVTHGQCVAPILTAPWPVSSY